MTTIPPMEFVGKAVRQLRKERNMTLEDLANAIDSYDSSNLSRFERGSQNIDPAKLPDIASALGTKVSDIYAIAETIERASAALKAEEPTAPTYSEPQVVTLTQLRHPHDPFPAEERPVIVAVAQLASVGTAPEDAAWLRVRSDDMARIPAGSVLIVDTKDAQPVDGTAMVLEMAGQYVLRKIRLNPNSVTLSVDSSPAAALTISAAEFKEQVRVVGRPVLTFATP